MACSSWARAASSLTVMATLVKALGDRRIRCFDRAPGLLVRACVIAAYMMRKASKCKFCACTQAAWELAPRVKAKSYRTRDAIRVDVVDYIESFYKTFRRHSAIGHLSQVEPGLFSGLRECW